MPWPQDPPPPPSMPWLQGPPPPPPGWVPKEPGQGYFLETVALLVCVSWNVQTWNSWCGLNDIGLTWVLHTSVDFGVILAVRHRLGLYRTPVDLSFIARWPIVGLIIWSVYRSPVIIPLMIILAWVWPHSNIILGIKIVFGLYMLNGLDLLLFVGLIAIILIIKDTMEIFLTFLEQFWWLKQIKLQLITWVQALLTDLFAPGWFTWK